MVAVLALAFGLGCRRSRGLVLTRAPVPDAAVEPPLVVGLAVACLASRPACAPGRRDGLAGLGSRAFAAAATLAELATMAPCSVWRGVAWRGCRNGR